MLINKTNLELIVISLVTKSIPAVAVSQKAKVTIKH